MARRYNRDARGRFAPKGYSGQSGGKGARLKSGKGNTRQGGGAKMQAAKPAGTIGKPKGLKPQSSQKLKTGVAASRMKAINAKMAGRPDIAAQHIPGRFSGQAGKRMDASIARAASSQKAASRAESKALNRKVKSEMSRAKKLRDVHESKIAKSFAKKHNKSVADVRSAIRGMTPAQQIKFFKQHVKETRKGKRK